MALDPERYRREVLDPARAAGNRPPDDLFARYQLTEPITPAQVRAQVEATLAHWHKQKTSLAYRRVIDALEADHRRLHSILDRAKEGDLTALRAELAQVGDRQHSRGATLRGELTSLAGSLGMLLPSVVEQMVAKGHDRAELAATLRELRIEVREPDVLATEAPVRGFGPLCEQLATLQCRHIADFLFGRDALAGGFGVLDGFSVPGRVSLRLDDAAVAERAAHWAKRLEGKSVPEAVLSTLRRLTPAERAALLTYECAYELRSWRDLRADLAALEQRATDLGLVKRDAQRFAFAVGSERAGGAQAGPLAGQLADLIAQRRLVAAHRLVTGLGESLPADCQVLAEQATRLGGRALELQRQAAAAGDPDTAWRLLDEAEQLAGDLSDVEAMRRQWPPQPPRSISATVDGARVLLRWEASPSVAGPIRYQVWRSSTAPGGEGSVLAETSATAAEDPSPPVNTACSYSVVASREGATSTAVRTATPVVYRPELSDLAVAEDDGVVMAAWSVPAGAGRVLARRAEHPPRDQHDGDPVPVAAGGFTDRDVRDGVTYHYLISVSYMESDGRETSTPGLRFTGTSVRAPEPVSRLMLEAVPDEPTLLARFAAPAVGTVVLYELDGPPPPAGTRLRTPAVPGRPVVGTPAPGGLRCPAPDRAVVLVAVTVNGGRAVIGDSGEWVPPTATPLVVAQRRGDGVHLSWEWPRGVVEMEVRWRADDGAWHTTLVSTAQYRAEGGVHLPHQGSRTEIVVAALIRGVDRSRYGPGQRVLVSAPVPAAYTLHRDRKRPGEVVVTVTAARRVRVPRLVLLVGGGDFLPLRATDGEVLAEAVDFEVDPDTPVVLRAAMPSRRPPFWLRCFAPGDAVELRDPAREQLRVG